VQQILKFSANLAHFSSEHHHTASARCVRTTHELHQSAKPFSATQRAHARSINTIDNAYITARKQPFVCNRAQRAMRSASDYSTHAVACAAMRHPKGVFVRII